MELARKRRQKAAKDKEDALAPMVIKPALSRLRTGAVSRRKKGGQRLTEMAKKSRQTAEKRLGGKTYVTPTPKRKTAPKTAPKKGPKMMGPEFYRRKRTPTSRTPAKRAADKKRLQNQMSETRSLGKLSSGMTKDLSKAQRATWEAIIGLATGGIGKGVQLGKGVHTAYKAKKAADVARAAAKAKRAAAAAKKAAEAKKGVSGIGATRAASARARTSGLGKPKPKPKAKKKKKSAAQVKRESMRGGSQWR